MINLSSQERLSVVARVSYAMSLVKSGEDARAVLSRMYCEAVPGTFPWQGQMIAEEIIANIVRYQECFDSACPDEKNYCIGLLAHRLSDLPLEEQCKALFAIGEGLRAFDEIAAGAHLSVQNRQELLDGLMSKVRCFDTDGLPKGNALAAKRDALLVQVSSALSAAAIPESLVSRIGEFAHEKEGVSDSVVLLRSAENMKRAITAMVIYTMAVNGELSQTAEDVSVSHVVIGTWMESDFRKISSDLNRNFIVASQAQEQMEHVWQYGKVLSTIGLLAFGVVSTLAAETIALGLVSAACTIAMAVLVVGPIDRAIKELIRCKAISSAQLQLKLEDYQVEPLPEVTLTPKWRDYLPDEEIREEDLIELEDEEDDDEDQESDE